MIRKWLCLLLVCMLVFPVVSGLADNPDGETLEYLYSFIPGTVLEGEGTKMIRELLDEVKIRFLHIQEDGSWTQPSSWRRTISSASS